MDMTGPVQLSLYYKESTVKKSELRQIIREEIESIMESPSTKFPVHWSDSANARKLRIDILNAIGMGKLKDMPSAIRDLDAEVIEKNESKIKSILSSAITASPDKTGVPGYGAIAIVAGEDWWEELEDILKSVRALRKKSVRLLKQNLSSDPGAMSVARAVDY